MHNATCYYMIYIIIILSWDLFCIISKFIYLQNENNYNLLVIAILCEHISLLWPLYIYIVIEHTIYAKYDLYLFHDQLIQILDNQKQEKNNLNIMKFVMNHLK